LLLFLLRLCLRQCLSPLISVHGGGGPGGPGGRGIAVSQGLVVAPIPMPREVARGHGWGFCDGDGGGSRHQA
jgi:hypothetical protein